MVRTRLLGPLLDRWHRRVTAVVAGPGFGKTSLLSQAVYENALDPAGLDVWVSCAPGDDVPSVLAHRLHAALGTTAPEGGDVEALAQSVAESLAARAPVPVCLVLDDLHLVQPESGGAALLGELLPRLPTDAHLVVASRTSPPLPLARLYALGDAVLLREDDLAFDDDELARFAVLRRQPVDALRDVPRWPAVVELTASAASPVIGEFLWQEVLDQLPEERRRLLAVLALLGGATDGELSAATGRTVDAAELVAGLPLATVTGGRVELHSLWRPSLLALVDEEDQRRALRAVAALRREAADYAAGWFVSLFDNLVGKVTPAGVITTFRPPAALDTPISISAGADPNKLWITTATHGAIGTVTTAGVFAAVYTPTGAQAHADGDIALNPADQSLWWTSSNNSLGRLTPAGQVTSFATGGQVDGPIDLAVDSGSRAWFVSVNNRRVGFMETGGDGGPTLPGAPRSMAAAQTGASGSVRVTYRPPLDSGGDAITSYKAICSMEGHATRSAVGSVTFQTANPPIVVSGLDNGTQYRCTVQARNGVPGHGPNSNYYYLWAGAPRPPGSVEVSSPNVGKLRLTWPAATSFTGAPLLSYSLRCAPGDGTPTFEQVSVTTRSHTFKHLPSGTAYTCDVTARNRFGDSAVRAAAAPVTVS